MRRLLLLAMALLATLAPAGARAALRVVTTTADLAALVKEIGGGDVAVTAVASPGQDPHWVDPRPSLALELAKADLLIVTGLDLEVGWLPKLVTGARNPQILPGRAGYLDASRAITPLAIPAARDRSQGDVHPRGSPHYLLDPRRAVPVVKAIAERMGQRDPERAPAYRERGEQSAQRITKWRAHWEAKAKKLKGKKLVAYHQSFDYLSDWLKFSVIAHVEPRPGIPPNPRHVAQVIETMKRERVPVLLQEPWFPDTTSKLIAQKAGAALVKLPGAPDAAKGESYVGYMNRVVEQLLAGLER